MTRVPPPTPTRAYDVPNAQNRLLRRAAPTMCLQAFRGFGVTQSAFAVEQNMDLWSQRRLGIDPIELRLINAQKVGVTTATRTRYYLGFGKGSRNNRQSAGGYAELSSGAGAKVTRHTAGVLPVRIKIQVWSGGAPDKARRSRNRSLNFEDGTIEVRIAAADMGQGIAHVVAQCAAEELSLP